MLTFSDGIVKQGISAKKLNWPGRNMSYGQLRALCASQQVSTTEAGLEQPKIVSVCP